MKVSNNDSNKGNLGGFKLLKNVPEGSCKECAIEHDPEQPHNAQSLFYQYQFMEKHGRWPTWKDALEHCPADVTKVWKDELEKRGVTIDPPESNYKECQRCGLKQQPDHLKCDDCGYDLKPDY